ncbi:Hypothetical predicted protein [Mytilus galloprovincialis]|uniref:Uncharacterized protein n=1 Tax=Mytilus galloprovincialis TaxID=29158 RepID=A0A8B6EUD9_MYTGA|nr:Hypothetical predicted protein [Mytilus galloprovincialis]
MKSLILYHVLLLTKVFCADVNITGLMDTLFENYHKDVRPLCDSGSAVKVKVGMALRQVIDLNEPRQILEINAWIRLRWHDCDLKWNSTEFGTDKIIIPVNRIWVPDITLYDNVGDQLAGLKDYRPVVTSNGDISYNFPTVITSMCPVDVTFFPFDTQSCLLKFGSWAYHGFEVDIINLSDTGDISSFVPSVEWAVVGIPSIRNVILYGCCPEPYPDVTFYVVLDRKPLFYMMSLIFPCMLITAVACLGFMLPPDSGEKVSLEITVLLSLAVFLLVVSETMPPSSENFPYIGIYFACSMLLVSFSCLMTVIVLSMHYKGIHGREMPQIVKTIFFDYIAKFVCMTTVRRRARRCSIHPVSPQTEHLNQKPMNYIYNGQERKVLEYKLRSTHSLIVLTSESMEIANRKNHILYEHVDGDYTVIVRTKVPGTGALLGCLSLDISLGKQCTGLFCGCGGYLHQGIAYGGYQQQISGCGGYQQQVFGCGGYQQRGGGCGGYQQRGGGCGGYQQQSLG